MMLLARNCLEEFIVGILPSFRCSQKPQRGKYYADEKGVKYMQQRKVGREVSSPVFIVGAGRSGTTLLYKMLCLHPDVAWISNYVDRVPKITCLSLFNRVCGIYKRHCRFMWFTKDFNAYGKRRFLMRLFPMPVEGESVYDHCGIPVFPDKSWCISEPQKKCLIDAFEKIRLFQDCKMLLSKRTANNRRIPKLLEAFPRAKFIHVIRDGRAVANSLLKVDWWLDHKVWWWHQKTPRQWESTGREPVEMAARNWVEEIREIEIGFKSVPDDQIFEVRYEHLPSNRVDILRRTVQFMELDCERPWIEEIRSLRVVSKNFHWQKILTEKQKAILLQVQSDTLEHFGYLI